MIPQALVIVGVLGAALPAHLAPSALGARPTTAAQQPPTQKPVKTLPPANAAFTEFKAELDKYLTLRAVVESTLPKLDATKDPKKIAERAALLAAGIATARKGVKPGQIFTPAVTAEFRRILAADAAKRTTKEKANIMAEVPAKPPVINGQYPTDSPTGPAALASFPPNLLMVLPELPDTVEYRFLSQSLVLRDTSANLIIDYLPASAPGRGGRGAGGGAQ
jgi:hypothetical protein